MNERHGGLRVEKGHGRFNFRSFFKLINQVHPKYWQFILGIIIGLIATGINLWVPKMAQKLINSYNGHLDKELVVITIGLFIAGTIISAFSGLILGVFGENVVANLRRELWGKLLKLPVRYFDRTKTGEIASRLSNDTSQVKNLLANTVPNALTSLLQFVGALVIMIAMDWKMTAIIFITVPIVFVAVMPVMKIAGRIGWKRQDELVNFAGDSTNILSEIRLVKSSNSEKKELVTGKQRINNLYNIGVKEAKINSLTTPLTNMMMMVLFIGVLSYGAVRVMNHSLSMGTLISFLMYLFQMMGPVMMVSQLFNELAKTSGSTERIQEMLNEDEEKAKAEKEITVIDQPLKLEHVDFAYEEGKQILHDINVVAKPNTVVAFAGPSGGGKTTIFSLIERFYQPTAGTIKIGNENIDNISLSYWRKQIGLVGQNSAVMPGTIRENLIYGLDREVNDDELWRVLEMAYADKFVRELDNQLDTEIGERGVKISGGQRQRIAIARAFLRNPKILMLDEATASLDSESESMVQKALATLMKGRTTLIIAHRLSTIVDADQIYFIDHGTVSGSGTHKELIKSTPLYAEYVHNQFKASNGEN